MLILTRRIGETVVIGNNITISVLGIQGNQIRLGINAPKDISVHREEIYKMIQSESKNKAEESKKAKKPKKLKGQKEQNDPK